MFVTLIKFLQVLAKIAATLPLPRRRKWSTARNLPKRASCTLSSRKEDDSCTEGNSCLSASRTEVENSVLAIAVSRELLAAKQYFLPFRGIVR